MHTHTQLLSGLPPGGRHVRLREQVAGTCSVTLFPLSLVGKETGKVKVIFRSWRMRLFRGLLKLALCAYLKILY